MRRFLWQLRLISRCSPTATSPQAARAARSPQTRTQVVFGSGSPTADLMFVGEAPGFHEDKQGVPFVGAAGKLLGKLLEGIGLTREDVYVANVLKCRPPGNRDPQPEEIESCEPHLWKQIELIQPKLIATLGNFATKLLSGKPNGITQVHGREQQVVLGGNRSRSIRSSIRRRRSTRRGCSRCSRRTSRGSRPCSAAAVGAAAGAAPALGPSRRGRPSSRPSSASSRQLV